MPASTVTSRSSTLSRITRFIRERSIETPPSTALTCPSSDEPAPNGTIGAPTRARRAEHSADLVGRERIDDDIRDTGRMPRFTVAVMLELCRVGRATIAEKRSEIRQQCDTICRRESRGHGRALRLWALGSGLWDGSKFGPRASKSPKSRAESRFTASASNCRCSRSPRLWSRRRETRSRTSSTVRPC